MTGKLLIIFMVLMGWFSASSQTTIWEDEFLTGEGWNMDENWTVANNRLVFSWMPQATNFDLRATSQPFYLNQQATQLLITQYLNIFYQSAAETAQIILITEEEEITVWDHPLTNGSWGSLNGTDLEIPVDEYVGQMIQVQFRTFGETTFNWNDWNVFNISVTGNFDQDIAATKITGPKSLELFEPGIWTVDVKNLGMETMSGYTVSVYENTGNALIGSLTESGSIEPGETRFYDISWQPQAAFNTSFKAVVESIDDQFAGNNKSASMFVRIKPEMEMNILLWDNDNGIQSVLDPEKGDMVQPSTGLKRILDDADIMYELASYLPANLDDYDIVFCTMGNYCLS